MEGRTRRDPGPEAPSQHVVHIRGKELGDLYAGNGVRVYVRCDQLSIAQKGSGSDFSVTSREPVGKIGLERRRPPSLDRQAPSLIARLQLYQLCLGLGLGLRVHGLTDASAVLIATGDIRATQRPSG
jgi:hypothetical protein